MFSDSWVHKGLFELIHYYCIRIDPLLYFATLKSKQKAWICDVVRQLPTIFSCVFLKLRFKSNWRLLKNWQNLETISTVQRWRRLILSILRQQGSEHNTGTKRQNLRLLSVEVKVKARICAHIKGSGARYFSSLFTRPQSWPYPWWFNQYKRGKLNDYRKL